MSERSNFEQVWEDAFDGAEVTPAMSVWSNVRAELSTRQAKKQSGLVIYWRWMAAASIALLLGVGIGSFYYSQSILNDYEVMASKEQKLLQDIALLEEGRCGEMEQASLLARDESTPFSNNQEQVADTQLGNQLASNSETGSNKTVKNSDASILPLEVERTEALANVQDDGEKIDSKLSNDNTSEAVQTEMNVVALSNEETTQSATNIVAISSEQTDEEVAASKSQKRISRTPRNLEPIKLSILAQIDIDIQPQMIPDMMEILKMQNGVKQNFRGMWAGLSIGGGSFESNINRGEGDALVLSNSVVEGISSDGQSFNAEDVNQQVVESPAFSYAISADFGKQIGNRTFLQGGVEYSRYSSGAMSNVAINDSNSDEQAFLRFENTAALDRGVLTTTDSYELANNFEYVAIPLKFGYQLLNRKIGISLSSGVSTNFFLKNTLKDKSGTRNDVEVTNGESSPYKPLNFNGLLGAEISYQWNEHYQLAIVPDYRISLNGVTKDDAFIQSNPTAFFLGFRFKYILK